MTVNLKPFIESFRTLAGSLRTAAESESHQWTKKQMMDAAAQADGIAGSLAVAESNERKPTP